ncbi:RICIN domain-containing protein [Streptomyces sp. NPDC058470]|uniref:RICIN domain-containing protein n=1 Tax=Streptomyces sp. NPDC058470 TaxID=3346515 RepID=UPI003653F6E2
MSPGEEEGEPIRGERHPAPGEHVTPGPGALAGRSSGPSTIPVVVSGDGSASIDGIPVPVMGGESVDVAILDTLHGYARNRNASVRAAISDPSAGYVAIVEVAPDGSSKLIEQRQEESTEDAGPAGPAGLTGPVPPTGFPGNAGPPRAERPPGYPDLSDVDVDDGHDDYVDDGDGDDDDAVAVAPESARPRVPTPARSLGLDREPVVRRKIRRQSDDEYEPPPFLRRPLGVGVAGVVAAAVIVVPLVMLGSGSGSGQDQGGQNQAADSSTAASTTPPTPLELTPSYSPSPIPSPSQSSSPSRSPSPSASTSAKPKAEPKPKTTAKAKATTTPKAKAKAKAKPAPKTAPKATRSPAIPTGRVLLKNKKYGFCLDLPGEGSVGVDTRVQDYDCKPTGDNQDWTLDLVSKGGGTAGADLYLIRNVSSNLCLDLPNYGTVLATTPVSVYHCRPNADNQLWWFDKRPNGTYWVRNQKSGDMCLDVARTSKQAVTAKATVFECNANDDHEWSFPKS